MGYWETRGESGSHLESSPTGLLSHVLMEVTKIPVEEGLCTAVPCKLEFSKDSPSNSMIIGYWLNKNISFPIAINQPSVTRDNNTDGRFHIIWNLEEQDCTLLIHNVLKKDNMTYLSYAEPGKQKSALLKNITLSMSGDIQSHAVGSLERRNSRRNSDNCVVLPYWVLGFTELSDSIFATIIQRDGYD